MTHWLVTSAGTTSREVTYVLPDGRRVVSMAATPVAVQVLEGTARGRPDRIALLSTRDGIAAASWVPEVERSGIVVEVVQLERAALDDPWALLGAVLALGWEPADAVSFDLTPGPRAVGLAFSAAAVLLESLLGCEIAEVLLMSAIDDEAPVRRAGELIEATRWAAGVGAALGSGPVQPVARLADLERRSGRWGESWSGGARAASGLGQLADALTAANVTGVLGAAGRAVELEPADGAKGQVLHRIFELSLAGFARLVPEGDEPVDTLDAQLRLAERYLEWNDPLRAGLVLREWLVNRELAARRVPADAWNARAERTRAEAGLHRASGVAGSLWTRVRDLRNPLAHAGFDHGAAQKLGLQPLQGRLDAWRRLVVAARRTLDVLGTPDDAFGQPLEDRHILLIPLGLSRDVLPLAAAAAADGAHGTLGEVFVVTSVEVADGLPAHGAPGPVQNVKIVDPYAPATEGVVAEVFAQVRAVARLSVCLTGGTTALGLLVSAVADLAERNGAAVARFLLDRDGRARFFPDLDHDGAR